MTGRTAGPTVAAARRAVVLVGGTANPYSRALRVARALADEGFEVEIAAVAADGLPEDQRDGEITVRRYRPSGRLTSMAATHGESASAPRRSPRHPIQVARRALAAVRRWVFWPHTVRAWWATLARELAPADLYHACGSLTIAAALAARDRHPIGPAGRPATVIYDAIDDVISSNNMLGTPSPVRRILAGRERRWARAADARTTVNEAIAERLAARWGTPPPLVIPNHPELPVLAAGAATNRIRERLGLPATCRIVLFQGRLAPNLGLDEAAEAVLGVPDAALVLIGFGRRAAESRARDADARYQGRHFTLPPLHPDELPEWTASADVSLVPLPPASDNQRLSTPNKFWESLIVGTPVVVPADLGVMASIVRADGVGVVAASASPSDLAAAVREVLDRPVEARTAERLRIASLARARYSWPAAAARYRELARALAGSER